MQIEQVNTEEGLRFDIHGKIDGSNCEEFQKEILEGLRQSNVLILNIEDVTYVSSAALRVLVVGQKTASAKGAKFVITNANQTVRNSLNITGISGILDIR
ncbi:MAG: STAS domain-containing protein [Lachnospiraceae bacterium]|nr:STAS domain-containing protein [Lachnospiraceae bacterium]